jgi:teichuronic acid biosynthesis glycosyltransferase TuaG
MQGKTNLVSVIIPAYNASHFIEETIRSILGQTYSNWEVIVIDDGSTDGTASICEQLNDERVKVARQTNAGVAVARNNGLISANGEFVVFFDADDLMSSDFLSIRVQALQEDPEIGYVGGLVETFPDIFKTRKAAGSDPLNQILFFDSSFVTIPSNYLFKKEVLIKNKIFFNKELSSSADRFFILELSKFAKGKNLNNENGKLLYRVSSQSMSHHVTPRLIMDNEKFYYELKRKNLLPEGMTHKFNSLYFLSLAKGFGMVKYWKSVVKYLFMSFINHPVFFAENFGKSLLKSTSYKVLVKGAS